MVEKGPQFSPEEDRSKVVSELRGIFLTLFRKISVSLGEISGFDHRFTGIDSSIGALNTYNTPHAAGQLMFALALRAKHPEVQKIIQEKIRSETFDPMPLAEQQVLADMKILDLGCGYIPTFARCARKLGAEVYTVDVVPATEFEFDKDYFSEADRQEEIQKHIAVDLDTPDAEGIIFDLSGGDFDVATSSHLESGGKYNDIKYFPPHNFKEVAIRLLKEGGVYCNPLDFIIDGEVDFKNT